MYAWSHLSPPYGSGFPFLFPLYQGKDSWGPIASAKSSFKVCSMQMSLLFSFCIIYDRTVINQSFLRPPIERILFHFLFRPSCKRRRTLVSQSSRPAVPPSICPGLMPPTSIQGHDTPLTGHAQVQSTTGNSSTLSVARTTSLAFERLPPSRERQREREQELECK